MEWKWEKGMLTADNAGKQSFPYLHFLHWKKKWPPEMAITADVESDVLYIRRQGIFNDSFKSVEGGNE